jgi:hypothetical protein
MEHVPLPTISCSYLLDPGALVGYPRQNTVSYPFFYLNVNQLREHTNWSTGVSVMCL